MLWWETLLISVSTSLVIGIFAGMTGNFLSEYLWHKKTTSKNRFKWRIQKQLETSILLVDEGDLIIGTNKGILDSIFNTFKSIKLEIIENGFDNPKLSKKIQTYLNKDLRKFLSTYHKIKNELDKDINIDEKFINDFHKLRKKTKQIF